MFRARRVHVVPPSVLMLEPFVEAFSATFGVLLSDIKIANDDALDHTTIHDDHGVVQWMYLQDWQAGRGSVVLNLEGLEYDGVANRAASRTGAGIGCVSLSTAVQLAGGTLSRASTDHRASVDRIGTTVG